MTKNKIIDDVILRITKGKPSNDIELERAQVSHWVGITANEMATDALKASLGNSSAINGNYIIVEKGLIFTPEVTQGSSEYGNRNYVEILNKPLGLPYDAGIVYVTTDSGKEILSTTHTHISTVRELEMTKPSPSVPVYHREEKKLFIEGFTTTMMYSLYEYHNLTVHVHYVPSMEALDGDEELPISDDLAMELADRVEEIARRQHGQINDLINDGVE